MRETRTSSLMSGDRRRGDAIWPKQPRPSSTLRGVLAAGKVELGLGIGALQTLAFVTLVFGGQATLYAIRDRRHFGSTAETASPSLWLAVSSAADILIAATLAIGGFAMTPLPASVVAGVFGAACGFASVLSMVKTPVFGWLRIG